MNNIRSHVKNNTLIVIPVHKIGIVLERIDAYYYCVLVEGSVYAIHRDDFLIL